MYIEGYSEEDEILGQCGMEPYPGFIQKATGYNGWWSIGGEAWQGFTSFEDDLVVTHL